MKIANKNRNHSRSRILVKDFAQPSFNTSLDDLPRIALWHYLANFFCRPT